MVRLHAQFEDEHADQLHDSDALQDPQTAVTVPRQLQWSPDSCDGQAIKEYP